MILYNLRYIYSFFIHSMLCVHIVSLCFHWLRWVRHACYNLFVLLCLLSVCLCLMMMLMFVFVSSCVFCVHVCEHCVLCVYTFRPLSIPRRSPSDVSPNKLQNVKSRLNFHSIFQLASHQRGLSAQPSPNLLWTSIGFLIQAKHWISHTSWTSDFSYKLNIGFLIQAEHRISHTSWTFDFSYKLNIWFFMQTEYYLGNKSLKIPVIPISSHGHKYAEIRLSNYFTVQQQVSALGK